MGTFGLPPPTGSTSPFYSGNWTCKWGCRFQAPEDGTITNLAWLGNTNDAGGIWIYLAVYTDNSGTPNALMGYTSGSTVVSTIAWWTGSTVNISITGSSYYWLTVQFGNGSGTSRVQNGEANQLFTQPEGADGPPPNATFGSGSGTYSGAAMTIYATYTPSAGGSAQYIPHRRLLLHIGK